MTVRIEQGKDIFELNNGLRKMFPKLDNAEMEYVVFVADGQSILRLKPMKQRREIALKLVDGCWINGRPTNLGTRFMEGKNKDVEQAIIKYNKEINNNKQAKIMATLDTLNEYYDGLLKFMGKLDDGGDFDEQVKVYANNAKSIKDETIKATFEQIMYFEKQLGFEYEIPAEVAEDTAEKDTTDKFGADNIDVDKL